MPKCVWRGLRGMKVTEDFIMMGGTELAPMSTTTSLGVAAKYALSEGSVLLKLTVSSALDLGADLQWLSAFPDEAEVLYPPLTFLKPTGAMQTIKISGFGFHVVECVPLMP